MAEDLLGEGFRLGLVAAHDDGDALRVVYLFLAGRPDRRVELECLVSKDDPALRSLAYVSFGAGRFEREIADLYGIRPVGHPKARRLVRHAHWPVGLVSHAPKTPGPHPNSTVLAASRSSPLKGPECMRFRLAPCTPG